jgi:predicted nucleotide-binding protein
MIMGIPAAPHEFQAYLAAGKEKAIKLLEQAVRSLQEKLEDSVADATRASTVKEVEHSKSRKIFIVHGRDNGPKEAVARFLERMSFVPVILHEQPNQGRTVIEKIEAHSSVCFAVVLLSPDDEGGLKGEQAKPRARQNVLLELGYFVSSLGRNKVCALQCGEIEIPSDWQGILNGVFDETGAWKQCLARELESAGYNVDWNIVMRS